MLSLPADTAIIRDVQLDWKNENVLNKNNKIPYRRFIRGKSISKCMVRMAHLEIA